MPAQSENADLDHKDILSAPLKSSLTLPSSRPSEPDFFSAAATLSSHPLGSDTACIGKHQRERDLAAQKQGIRPGTLLREASFAEATKPAGIKNSDTGSSDYKNRIHNNNIMHKQNNLKHIKINHIQSDERHETRKEEANINKSFKLLNKINNSEFIQYDKIRMYNKNNEKYHMHRRR